MKNEIKHTAHSSYRCRASGQYRDEKPNAYYNNILEQSAKFVADIKSKNASTAIKSNIPKKVNSGAIAKG